MIHCVRIVLTKVEPAPVRVPDAQLTFWLPVEPAVVELLEVELELPHAAAVNATARAATPKAERRPSWPRARRPRARRLDWAIVV